MTDYQILTGHCLDTLASLADKSVHCVVTSPPYWGLRKYEGEQGVEWPAVSYAPMPGLSPLSIPAMRCGLGEETIIDAYIGHLILVMRELHRVLRDDGSCWVNLGDSYQSGGGGQNQPGQSSTIAHTAMYNSTPTRPPQATGLKPKDLCQIPARFSLAAQADGWYLRSTIIWHKKAPMPESCKDRPTSSYEPIFLLTKSERYYYDNEAVKEKSVDPTGSAKRYESAFHVGTKEMSGNGRPGNAHNTPGMKTFDGTRNQRNVWTLSPEPSGLEHYAAYPTEIPRRAILAGTSEHGVCPNCGAPWERVTEHTPGVHNERASQRQQAAANGARTGGVKNTTLSGVPGTVVTTGWQPTCTCNAGTPIPATVLDPFGGSGTTAVVALSLSRNAILCELSEEYAAMARTRIETKATTNWQTPTGTSADFDELPLFGEYND